MEKSLISNPPYNIKWVAPPFAQLQSRFRYGVPSNTNANFAFVLTGLAMVTDKAVFVLPCGVLSSSTKEEIEIRKELVENNLIDAVITLPEKMFESTSIPTCVILLNKNKTTATIEFIDLKQRYDIEERLQNGQFGGSSHTNRTYKKEIRVIADKTIDEVQKWITERAEVEEVCTVATIEELRKNDYSLIPTRYIGIPEREVKHRSYHDIVEDYNRIIREKSKLKITINESLAKSLGVYDTLKAIKDADDNSKVCEVGNVVGEKIETANTVSFSKKSGEFKFENNSKDDVSGILMQILSLWNMHYSYLNDEENRILAELRDALLPDLMSGKIKV